MPELRTGNCFGSTEMISLFFPWHFLHLNGHYSREACFRQTISETLMPLQGFQLCQVHGSNLLCSSITAILLRPIAASNFSVSFTQRLPQSFANQFSRVTVAQMDSRRCN